MAYTLAQLRTRVRERADLPPIANSGHVLDAELNEYINASLADLHDLLVLAYEDYFTGLPAELAIDSSGVGSSEFVRADPLAARSVTSGTHVIALPSNFYKLRTLERVDGANRIPLRALPFAERWRYTISSAHRIGYDRRYCLVGPNIHIYPSERAVGTYSLWYVPKFVPLSADADTPFAGTGVPDQYWTEYAIVDAAIKCLVKEESDPSALMAQREAIRRRLIQAAADRDAGEPARVLDIDEDTPAWPWWSR